MATSIPEVFSEAVDTRDVRAIRQHLIERFVGNPAEGGGQLADLVAQLEKVVPELWEEDSIAATVPRAMDAQLYFEALIAELRLHFAKSTWNAAVKAGKALRRPSDELGVSRWVSMVIVLGISAIGALILFGPPFIRYLFSNWS